MHGVTSPLCTSRTAPHGAAASQHAALPEAPPHHDGLVGLRRRERLLVLRVRLRRRRPRRRQVPRHRRPRRHLVCQQNRVKRYQGNDPPFSSLFLNRSSLPTHSHIFQFTASNLFMLNDGKIVCTSETQIEDNFLYNTTVRC